MRWKDPCAREPALARGWPIIEGPPDGPEPVLPVWTGRLRVVGGTDATLACEETWTEGPKASEGRWEARQRPFELDPTPTRPAA